MAAAKTGPNRFAFAGRRVDPGIESGSARGNIGPGPERAVVRRRLQARIGYCRGFWLRALA